MTMCGLLTKALARLPKPVWIGLLVGVLASLVLLTREPLRNKRGKGKESSGWTDGQLTYYWASEPDIGNGSGSKGANGKELVANVSLAVKGADNFKKYKGRRVEIEGMGNNFRVDDYCLGKDCKDLDYYVGKSRKKGFDGIKKIKYRFL